ncbi:hypothetical protein HDU87_008628 [Geranomyces variabilis]|uniref:Uncharacterized protein n=1 Tax=Geranomyces variabilis TaxID=109894 RepID=A0AAD5TCU3_9FUNG|nr:hypothetical protein HDU87_008628 [Geranomyces variabilis]
MPKKGILLQLIVVSPTSDSFGSITIVVPLLFTFWNLHRVIQFATGTPKTTDAAIDKIKYQVSQGDVKPKKGKLVKLEEFTLGEGAFFHYVCGGVTYTVTVESRVENAETQSYVPRLIEAANRKDSEINAVNTTLLLKRFGMNPSSNKKPRQAPALIVFSGESEASIWKTYWNVMRFPAKRACDEPLLDD